MTSYAVRQSSTPYKNRIVTLAFSSMVAMLSSCATSSPPGCSDDEVLQLVNDLSIEVAANAIVPIIIAQLTRTSPSVWGNPDYAALKRRAANPDDAQAQAVLAKVDEAISHVRFTFQGVRTDRLDEQTLKSWCSVEVTGYANEKLQGTDQLSYTAQYTDDGQIYVEIQP